MQVLLVLLHGHGQRHDLGLGLGRRLGLHGLRGHGHVHVRQPLQCRPR